MDTVSLHKFNTDPIPFSSRFMIISKQRYETLKKVMRFMTKECNTEVFPLVFGESSYDYDLFKDIVPPCMIHEKFDEEVMKNFRLRQKRLIRTYGKGHPKCKSIVVFNNCMMNTRFWENNDIKWLMKNGRHYDVCVIFRQQYAMSVPPAFRTCLEYIFVDGVFHNRKDKQRIYEQYFGVIPTFNTFEQVYTSVVLDQSSYCRIHETPESKECRKTTYSLLKQLIPKDLCKLITDQYCEKDCYSKRNGLVIKNRSMSNSIEDCVMWYDNCPLQKQLKTIGPQVLWDASI